MAEVSRLSSSEAMGSSEARWAIMSTRVASAKDNYDRAVAKNISPEAVQAAKEVWEARLAEHEDFMNKNGDEGAAEKGRPATVH
jgi:flagellar biosynthesis/type III secretory pathway protein FliH